MDNNLLGQSEGCRLLAAQLELPEQDSDCLQVEEAAQPNRPTPDEEALPASESARPGSGQMLEDTPEPTPAEPSAPTLASLEQTGIDDSAAAPGSAAAPDSRDTDHEEEAAAPDSPDRDHEEEAAAPDSHAPHSGASDTALGVAVPEQEEALPESHAQQTEAPGTASDSAEPEEETGQQAHAGDAPAARQLGSAPAAEQEQPALEVDMPDVHDNGHSGAASPGTMLEGGGQDDKHMLEGDGDMHLAANGSSEELPVAEQQGNEQADEASALLTAAPCLDHTVGEDASAGKNGVAHAGTAQQQSMGEPEARKILQKRTPQEDVMEAVETSDIIDA